MGRIAVFIIKGGGLKGMEGEAAERVSSHLLSEGKKKTLDIFEDDPLKMRNFYNLKEYAHRYGNCYESGRDDLIEQVPPDAGCVLDIGCANGLFGEALKRRQKCVVHGVEADEESVKTAEGRLDNVIKGDIEKIVDEGVLGTYDCIVCGDLLEHLNNPWKVVRSLKKHLKRGGLFIASTPNIANWAVIYEMLRGRWDYVPLSILSGTHVRFFSRGTLIKLFEGSGYKVKEAHLQSFGLPLRCAEFIEG